MENDIPQPIQNPNFDKAIELAKEYMEYLHSEDACEDTIGDYESPIFESIIEAVFGPQIWDYINKKIDEF